MRNLLSLRGLSTVSDLFPEFGCQFLLQLSLVKSIKGILSSLETVGEATEVPQGQVQTLGEQIPLPAKAEFCFVVLFSAQTTSHFSKHEGCNTVPLQGFVGVEYSRSSKL